MQARIETRQEGPSGIDPDWGAKMHLLTAYERRKGPAQPGKTIDTAGTPEGRRGDTALPPLEGPWRNIPPDDFEGD